MTAPGSLDWLFSLLGYTLAAVGAFLFLWSLFWDRSRGRGRCPKCWYDMSGTSNLKCPECGRETAHEAKLRKTRRRPFIAAASLFLLAPSVAVALYGPPGPRWLPAIPTLVLARVAPLSDPFFCSSPLDQELLRRLKARPIPSRALRWTLDRYFAAFPSALDEIVTTRSQWPADVSLAAVLNHHLYELFDPLTDGVIARARLVATPNGAPGPWATSRVEGSFDKPLGPAKLGNTIELQVELCRDDAVLWSGRLTKPVTVGGKINEVMLPVSNPALDAKIASWMSPVLMTGGSTQPLCIGDGTRDQVIGTNLAMGAVFEVLHDGRVVARGEYHWYPPPSGLLGDWPATTFVELDWDGAAPPTPSHLDGWTVRVRGDGALALRDFSISSVAGPALPDKPSYWSGTFERQLTVKNR